MLKGEQADFTSTYRWKLFRICSQRGMFEFMAERVKDMKYASVKEREALAKQLIAEIDTMETVPTTSKPNKIPAEVEEAVELME